MTPSTCSQTAAPFLAAGNHGQGSVHAVGMPNSSPSDLGGTPQHHVALQRHGGGDETVNRTNSENIFDTVRSKDRAEAIQLQISAVQAGL